MERPGDIREVGKMITLQWIEDSPRYARNEYNDVRFPAVLEDCKKKMLEWKKVRIIMENDDHPNDWVVVWSNHG